VRRVQLLLGVAILAPVIGCSLLPYQRSGPVRVYVTNTDDAAYTIQIAELREAWAVRASASGGFGAEIDGQVLFLVFDADCTVIGRYGIGPGWYHVTIKTVDQRPVADIQDAAGGMLAGPLLSGTAICPSW
jgi:hypothetical protein